MGKVIGKGAVAIARVVDGPGVKTRAEGVARGGTGGTTVWRAPLVGEACVGVPLAGLGMADGSPGDGGSGPTGVS